MVKKSIWFILFLMPLFLHAQGIKWTQNLSWEQVKEKAKSEKKYIFVDCYATWCQPCKKMDRTVYSDQKLDSINSTFISVKVQMDSTKEDSPEIRKWYSDAKLIHKTYKIAGYPTFLFFSPKGELVHEDIGYKNVEEFMAILELAIDPKKQFYALIENYKAGKITYSQMPALAQKAKQLKEKELSIQIATNYLNNYLYKQNESVLFQKENLSFMRAFVQTSSERGFRLFFRNSRKIDSIMLKDKFAEGLIDYIITKERITPILLKVDSIKANPDWQQISLFISKRYNKEIAYRNVINAKIRWYEYKKEWENLAKYHIEKIEYFGLDTIGLAKYAMNNMIWDVFFLHSNDIEKLNKAIGWMEVILKIDPYYVNHIDTYANLLYKAGRVKEAIRFETIAAQLSNSKEIAAVLEDMNSRKPTHINNGAQWNDNTLRKCCLQ